MIIWIITSVMLHVLCGLILCHVLEDGIDNTVWLYIFFWPAVVLYLAVVIGGGAIVNYFKNRR